ncbi:MAG TPA: F0F1 ATP synthase subunit epsilon [Gemmatimonadaceae bacterium]|jgi:F-type H+-transporting ATPase subunit epsilon
MTLPAHLALEIVTPDRAIVHDSVDEVQVPGSEGYFGVLPGHTPMLAMLQVGQLWYRKGSEKFYLSVAFGVAEVMPDRVIILADIAERAEEIDVDRAQSALHRAEQNMATRDQDLERARVSLLKAISRLNVAHRARTRG